MPTILIRVSSIFLVACCYCSASALATEDYYEIIGTSNAKQKCREHARETFKRSQPDKQADIPKLIDCLKHEYFYRPGASKYILYKIGTPALPALIAALSNRDYRVVAGSAVALGMIGPGARETAPALKSTLRIQNASPESCGSHGRSRV